MNVISQCDIGSLEVVVSSAPLPSLINTPLHLNPTAVQYATECVSEKLLSALKCSAVLVYGLLRDCGYVSEHLTACLVGTSVQK